MELRRISLKRDQTSVFADFTLKLSAHRIGLIGPNGSGKSSLLRVIKGLLIADSGEIERPDAIGFVFQNPEHQLLFPTVMEELCFGLVDRGMDPVKAQERAQLLLADYGVQSWADKAVHELSDGQKQQLCIFSVLMDGAELILMDEPCSSLDHRAKKQIMSLIHGLPQQIIMATHDLDLLRDFDQVIWLDCGQVQMEGTPAVVTEAYRKAFSSD